MALVISSYQMKSPRGSPRDSVTVALATSSRTSVMFSSLLEWLVRARSGGFGDLLQRVEQWLEAAPEHALAVERHFHRAGLHLGIGHQLFPGRVAYFLARPQDEREDDIFVVRRLHRAIEIGSVAVLKTVAEALDRADRAMRASHCRELLRLTAIFVFLALW